MEHLKEITQKPQMRPFIKEVYESVFKHVLLNCTMNRDVCKKAWYNPFNSVLIRLFRFFLDGEVQNCTSSHYFW